MRAKDPAILFYTSDFLTGTMFMSNEQIGIYIKLLCSQHQHGGLIDKITFDNLVGEHKILRSKFIESDEGYFNERLTIEVEKRNFKSSNMSEAAKNIWKKRKLAKENDTIVKENTTIVVVAEIEDESKIIKKGINQIQQHFIDLENCSELETISMNAKVSMDYIRQKIITFKPKAELEYPNWKEFIKHFKNYVNKELQNEKNGTATKSGYHSNKANLDELNRAASEILSNTSSFLPKGGDTE